MYDELFLGAVTAVAPVGTVRVVGAKKVKLGD